MSPRTIPSSRNGHRLTFCLLMLSGVSILIGSTAVAQTKVVASPAASVQAQSASTKARSESFCEPSPEVEAALDSIYKRKQGSDKTDYDFWRSGLAAVQELRKRYPNDFFVQRAYVQSVHASDPSTVGLPSETGTLRVLAEYKALREHHPDDIFIEYLYATLLIDRDTSAAIQLFDDVLRKKPEFPWPHNDLVLIYASPNFLDKAKEVSHLSAFLVACPANIGAYRWLRGITDDGLVRKIAPQFRKVLETRNDADAIREYRTLWSLEFKSHPSSEYDGIRKQVAVDLKRIRALKLENDLWWWSVLNEGYQLVDDQQQAKWAQDELDAHARTNESSASVAMGLWFKDHPYPKPDDPKEKKLAYSRDALKQTNEWIKKWPNSRDVWEFRMNAMTALDDVPAGDYMTAIEKRLTLEQANNGPLPLYWWTYFEFADFLSQKNIEPAREVELAQKGLDTIVAQWENIPQKDLNSTKDDTDFYPNFYWPGMKARALLYKAEGYARLKQADMALAALGKVNLQLQALNSDMSADESRRQLHERNALYRRYESQYWQGMGRVAEVQGLDTDAMAYYQSALLARFDSNRMPSSGDKDELGDEAHVLWAKIGGTEDGWKIWYGRRADVLTKQAHLEWEKAQEPLPAFELTDLHGKTWKPADLEGKVVFLNFWASW